MAEQLREPERRITRNVKSTSTAAARLRWSFGCKLQRCLMLLFIHEPDDILVNSEKGDKSHY
jgi:hypothetical protein